MTQKITERELAIFLTKMFDYHHMQESELSIETWLDDLKKYSLDELRKAWSVFREQKNNFIRYPRVCDFVEIIKNIRSAEKVTEKYISHDETSPREIKIETIEKFQKTASECNNPLLKKSLEKLLNTLIEKRKKWIDYSKVLDEHHDNVV